MNFFGKHFRRLEPVKQNICIRVLSIALLKIQLGKGVECLFTMLNFTQKVVSAKLMEASCVPQPNHHAINAHASIPVCSFPDRVD